MPAIVVAVDHPPAAPARSAVLGISPHVTYVPMLLSLFLFLPLESPGPGRGINSAFAAARIGSGPGLTAPSASHMERARPRVRGKPCCARH